MDTLKLNWGGEPLTFERTKALADAIAEEMLGGAVNLSFWDRDRNLEAPGHVSECKSEICNIPGWLEYAQHRGGKLMVDYDDGRFVFCYRDLGEFG